jgi:hypothetical protein
LRANPPSQRGIWLAIITLASLCIATVAGMLFLISGAEPPAVLEASGAAFVSSASLGFAAHRFVTG